MAYQLLVITWPSDDRFIENWVAWNQDQWSVDQYALLPHLKIPPAKRAFYEARRFKSLNLSYEHLAIFISPDLLSVAVRIQTPHVYPKHDLFLSQQVDPITTRQPDPILTYLSQLLLLSFYISVATYRASEMSFYRIAFSRM